VYEVIATSSGTQPFYVGLYEQFTPESPCATFFDYMGQSFIQLGTGGKTELKLYIKKEKEIECM
jgi:hypothetical protein